MSDIFIIDAKRTPVGKYGGTLSTHTAINLAITVVKNIIQERKQIKKDIDEVIIGNVLSAGLGQNPARIVSINSGLPNKAPAFTINKVCGSGLKSVVLATQAIKLGDANLVLAGGMENMSRAPFYLYNYRFGVKFGHQQLQDGMILDGLYCSLIGEHMGITAENIAKKYQVSRLEQDEYSYYSHMKAIEAINSNYLDKEIVPIKVKKNGVEVVFKTDEQPRPDTSIEKLEKLKPVFKQEGSVTAGNSSSINDGAAITLLASEKAVKSYNLKPKAIVLSYSYIGLDPNFMGMGGYYTAKDCIKKSGLRKSDIDLWEINEAFASQSIAVIKKLDIDPKKINITGGAIALGHPIGASGSRILTTLLYNLKRTKRRYGLATLCIGGGQGIALLIESIN